MTKTENPLLSALMAEARKFCGDRRGRVSALADHLGVLQQQASTWLNEKSEPGGEATLQIRAWLEAQRAAETAARAQLVQNTPPRLSAAMKEVTRDKN